jgi:acyl carrier protein
MNTLDWILNWFEENAFLDKGAILSNLNSNYFERGWIDSIRFISFLADLEEEFEIEFNPKDFENRDFSCMEGLVKIIEAKRQ